MKRFIINILVLFYALLCCSAADRGVAFVETREAGELERLLGDELLMVEELTVRGPVNEADFKAMSRAAYKGRLRVLDIAGADIGDKKVPDYAFSYSDGMNMVCSPLLSNLVLPDNIEEIGAGAFENLVFLKDVNLPKSLVRIGERAFCGCLGLELDAGCLPATLAEIADQAFMGCPKIADLRFPDNLKHIGISAFESTGLASAILPAGIQTIGQNAFARCRSLREAYVPDMSDVVNGIGKGVFEETPLLESHVFHNGYVPGYYAKADFSLREVKLPEGAIVWSEAFALCRGLEYVELPEGLGWLFDGAFLGCARLKTLVLPSSLKQISNWSLCLPGLRCLYCKAPVPPEFMAMHFEAEPFFYNHAGSSEVSPLDTPRDIPVYVPVGSAELYREAPGWNYFNNYIEIADFPTAAQLRNEHTEPELGHVEVTLRNPGELAERLGGNIRNIVSLTVRGPVGEADFATMREAAFNGRLEELDLSGASVEGRKIPEGAFWNSKEMRQHGVNCPTWLRRVVLPDGIEEIGDNAFSYSIFLEEINLPRSVRRIGSDAFCGCENLDQEMTLPDGLVEIADGAFNRCAKLKDVGFSVSLRTIGANAFASTGIKTVHLPEGVETVGELAFSECIDLTKAVLPNSITDMSGSKRLFQNDINLVSIQLPNDIKEIPEFMANGCQSLRMADLPRSVDMIGASAFCKCRSLERVSVPERVSTVLASAFNGCFNVRELILSGPVNRLHSWAFSEMPGLECVYSSSPVPPFCQLGYKDDMAFGPFETYYGNPISKSPADDTPRDIPVYVPRGSAEAYRNAPGWNYFTNLIETDEFPEAGVDGAWMEDGAVEVRVASGRVILAGNGAAASDYAIHSIDGRQVAAGCVSVGDAVVSVAPGLYIVAVGATAVKVFVP